MARRQWPCNLIGHRYDPGAAWHYGIDSCMSCGAEEPDPASLQPWHLRWIGRWRWGLECWLRDRRQTLSAWWHPCPDCGRRFGRHRPEVEHLPF